MSEKRAEYHAGESRPASEFYIQSEGTGPDRIHKIMLANIEYATAKTVGAALYLVVLANIGLKAECEK